MPEHEILPRGVHLERVLALGAFPRIRNNETCQLRRKEKGEKCSGWTLEVQLDALLLEFEPNEIPFLSQTFNGLLFPEPGSDGRLVVQIAYQRSDRVRFRRGFGQQRTEDRPFLN